MYAKQTFFSSTQPLCRPSKLNQALYPDNQRGEISAPPSLYWRWNHGLGCATQTFHCWATWPVLMPLNVITMQTYVSYPNQRESKQYRLAVIHCCLFISEFEDWVSSSSGLHQTSTQPKVILISWSACFCFPSVGSPDLHPQNSTEELPMRRDSPVSPHILPPAQGFWAG